jgi:release factor glutamine methyltransferase
MVKRILDVGTGSGNISIVVAGEVKGVIIDAIDINKDSLRVARNNVRYHRLSGRIRLQRLDFLSETGGSEIQCYDLIISNPPYIPYSDFKSLQPEIKDFEPPGANTDFKDGLTFYKALAEKGSGLLRKGGWIFAEIGYSQWKYINEIFRKFGYSGIRAVKDYGGIKRVIKARVG